MMTPIQAISKNVSWDDVSGENLMLSRMWREEEEAAAVAVAVVVVLWC